MNVTYETFHKNSNRLEKYLIKTGKESNISRNRACSKQLIGHIVLKLHFEAKNGHPL